MAKKIVKKVVKKAGSKPASESNAEIEDKVEAQDETSPEVAEAPPRDIRIVDVFEGDDIIEVYVADPDRQDRVRADSNKTKAWYNALEIGCLPRDQMLNKLRDKGIWSNEQEAETTQLQGEMEGLLTTLDEGGISLADARANSIRIVEIRNHLEATLAQKISYMSETIEAKASEAEFDYFVYACAVYNNNRRKTYFKDYDDYMSRKDSLNANIIARRCSEVLYGLPDLDDTPEKQFLSEYGFVDENLHLINEDGHLIDIDGKLVDKYGNYIKYVGRGDKKRSVIVDINGEEIKEVKRKPFLDEKGKPVKAPALT